MGTEGTAHPVPREEQARPAHARRPAAPLSPPGPLLGRYGCFGEFPGPAQGSMEVSMGSPASGCSPCLLPTAEQPDCAPEGPV